MEIVNSLPEEKWRKFVDEHPAGNIFHTPEMFNVYEKAKYHQSELWAAVKDGKPIALLLPVTISLWGGILKYFTSRAIVFGSVLYDSGDDCTQALIQLLDAYKKEMGWKVLFTELRNLSDLIEIQPILISCNFVYEQHLNYLIDLDRDPKDIFAAIGDRTRKNIRHGLNKGQINIEEVTDRNKIGVCYNLIKQTYSNARVPLADSTLFEAAFDLLYPKGMVKFFLASVGEIPVATSVELFFKDVIYGWYSGLNREYRSYVPNELLMWHILQLGSRLGYRTYDFGGAGKPNEKYGVREFKAKFGGRLVCFGRNVWVKFPLLFELSKINYSLYRKLH